MQVKNIGILTSGGDAPGMNAAIRAVVRAGIKNGLNVYGIYRGYNGLIDGDIKKLDVRDVSDIIQLGGTMLYTARCEEFRHESGIQKAKQTCEKYGIDSMVVIGGDGSFRGAAELSKQGIKCVCIPGTIDNDISCFDYTIGYDTALNTAIDMIDKIRDTAQSHYRCSIVEVMGRRAGSIALNTGIACGATCIIVPEVQIDQQEVIDKIKYSKKIGKRHFIVLTTEGLLDVNEFAKKIEKETGIESRGTVLGHVQRGGSPTVRDRVVASRLGVKAVELLCKGENNRVVGIQKEEVVYYDIQESLKMKKSFDQHLYNMSYEISF